MVIFILGAFLVFQKYIARGLSGRWKAVGDSFGQGRVFSESKTKECVYDYIYFNKWYDRDCYEASCDCQTLQANATTCKDCIKLCSMSASEVADHCAATCDRNCNPQLPNYALCLQIEQACTDACVSATPGYSYCQ